VYCSHAKSKNAFFGFLVLLRTAPGYLRHRQECLCYLKTHPAPPVTLDYFPLHK
jgi:hypothetical protein